MDTLNVLKLVVVLTVLCSVCYGHGYRSGRREIGRKCGANGYGVCVKSSQCTGYPIHGNCGYGSVCCQQFRDALPCQYNSRLFFAHYPNMTEVEGREYITILSDGKVYNYASVDFVLGRFIILRVMNTTIYVCAVFDETQSGPDNIVAVTLEQFELDKPLDRNNISNICHICPGRPSAEKFEYVALGSSPTGFSDTFCTAPPGCGGPDECDDFGSLDKFNVGCHKPRRYSYNYYTKK